MTARSKPTITLIDYRLHLLEIPIGQRNNGQDFRVDKLSGSTNYTIGQWFTKNQVNSVIQSGWNVNLRGPKKGEL